MPDWALAITGPNAEHLLAADLKRFYYPFLLFKRRSSIVHRGKIVERLLPAFPRYVFVKRRHAFDILHGFSRALDLVRFDDTPDRVPVRTVEELIERCDGGDVFPAEIIPEPFAVGDRVYVGGYGPMAGHEGIYKSRSDNGKQCLYFDWAGRLVPIDVDQNDVSSVSVLKRRKRRRRPGRRRRQAARMSTAATVH